jgi:hypothetical protein
VHHGVSVGVVSHRSQRWYQLSQRHPSNYQAAWIQKTAKAPQENPENKKIKETAKEIKENCTPENQ